MNRQQFIDTQLVPMFQQKCYSITRAENRELAIAVQNFTKACKGLTDSQLKATYNSVLADDGTMVSSWLSNY